VHDEAADPEYSPGAQSVHEVCPVLLLYFPASHALHVVAPAELE
jgi:hypothetical protein